MKKSNILSIIGWILLLVGIYFFQSAYYGEGVESFTIPSGIDWYYRVEFYGRVNGGISGDFSVANGTINFYVMTEEQRKSYYDDGESLQYIFASQESKSGHFSTTTCPAFETWYIITDHGVGYESTPQKVTVGYKLSGFETNNLLISIIIFTLAIILLIVGKILGKKKVADKSTFTSHINQPFDAINNKK